jgi:hypothetical protein
MNRFIAILSNRPLLFEQIVKHLHEAKTKFVPIMPNAILFEHRGSALSAYRVLEAATDLSAKCSSPKGQIAVFQIHSEFRADPLLANEARLKKFFEA